MVRVLKLFVVAIATTVFNAAIAAPVSLDVKAASIAEFVELVFKSVLHRDYILGPGLLGVDPRITVSVGAVEGSDVLALATDVLGQYGVAVDASGPVVRLSRSAPAAPSGQGVPLQAAGGAAPVVGAIAAPGAPLAALPGVAGAQCDVLGVGQDAVRIEVYRPRFRSAEALAEIVKLAGVKVGESKGSQMAFCGSEERLRLVADLLARVDRAPGVVEVRAMLVEFSEGSESNYSMSGALNVLAGRLGVVLAGGAASSNALTLKGKSLAAVVTALDGDSRFRQLAEPRLRVVDGAKARVVVGSDFPVRGQIATDKAGNAVASIDYKQAGIVLDLTPQVFADAVLLTINQQVSSVSVTTTSGIDSPTVNKREVSTVVNVRSGELVVLAGLDDSNESSTSSGLAFLPSWLHGSRRASGRTQVFLLMEVNRVSPESI